MIQMSVTPIVQLRLKARQRAVARRAQLVASTEEVRARIRDHQHLIWRAAQSDVHLMTATCLGAALAKLGLYDGVAQLAEEIRSAANKQLKHLPEGFSKDVTAAQLAHGEYDMLAPPRKERWKYSRIISMICHADLATAELRLNSAIPRTFKNRPDRSLMRANAKLAIVSHWLGEPEKIQPALQRFRWLLEQTDEISTRPLSEDLSWIDLQESSGSVDGDYFLLTLIHCGQAELGCRLWKQLSNLDAAFLCNELARAGVRELCLGMAQKHLAEVPRIGAALDLHSCGGRRQPCSARRIYRSLLANFRQGFVRRKWARRAGDVCRGDRRDWRIRRSSATT